MGDLEGIGHKRRAGRAPDFLSLARPAVFVSPISAPLTPSGARVPGAVLFFILVVGIYAARV